MIVSYILLPDGSLSICQISVQKPLPNHVIWLDMIHPTDQERSYIEDQLDIECPRRSEMEKIEVITPFYTEKSNHYMTINGIREDDRIMSSYPITFILTPKILVSLRYYNFKIFDIYSSRAYRRVIGIKEPESILIDLLQLLVHGAGDLLEKAGNELDLLLFCVFKTGHAQKAMKEHWQPNRSDADKDMEAAAQLYNGEFPSNQSSDSPNNQSSDADETSTRNVFARGRRHLSAAMASHGSRNFFETHSTDYYRDIMGKMGINGNIISRTNESLLSINRMLIFLTQTEEGRYLCKKEHRVKSRTLIRDVQSLIDYGHFLSNKNSFLLEATLGMINIEQNNITKVFSIMSSIFMPPTLVASIYGMNVKLYPNTGTPYGFAILLFVIASFMVAAYLYLRRKKMI